MKSKNPRGKLAKPSPPSRDKGRDDSHDFLIVGIGASAGGIEAFSELMKNLPADTGMAFVIVQHLDPKHHSILTELIAKHTSMRVTEVKGGMRVERDHVYIIPPNAQMSITDHALQLTPRDEAAGAPMSIDHFMRSLAEGQGDRAVGVILSGSGSDGTLGMAEIQAQGGVTFAQEPASAKYDSMPRSAIAAGSADYVLPPKGIARELSRLAQHPYTSRRASGDAGQQPSDFSSLGAIFQLLRRTTGVDFTHYRQTTILRRIQRRMVVHKIDSQRDYVKYVQTNPAEIKALYQDMLINVTSFFRNPRVFDSMKTEIFPAILRNRIGDAPIRVWTPGCASGEETYSIAIALLEFLGDRASQIPIQLFGTDVSESSIAKARAGVYPENIQGDVSAERLQRFFSKTESGYRISKSIRDMCIFAQHNVINDPPFSQMDLICCRNLLIYLEPVLQSRVIGVFHYATRPGGFLVLGMSEGVGIVTNLFTTIDRNDKIFLKKATASRQIVTFSLNRQDDREDSPPVSGHSKAGDIGWNYTETLKEFDRRLLSHYAPATVFLNEDLEIIHSRGTVNRYLKLAPGRASLSILKMAREGLLVDLRSAISRARKENTTVRRENVQVKVGSENGAASGADLTRLVNFEVALVRLGKFKELYFMVTFQEAAPAAEREQRPRRARKSESASASPHGALRAAKLEEELNATKEYLQSVIETQEATNEELQSANEEILSSNEELQSTNEELETAKEELQSANEELTTVNDELRSRNIEVTQVNNDLHNLLSSIEIAVIMIGRDFTIRRFTPEAQRLLGLIPGDVGRPIVNISPTIDLKDFQQLVLEVMSNSRIAEREVTDRSGGRYQMRVLPYRTNEGKVDGAVVTVVDLTKK